MTRPTFPPVHLGAVAYALGELYPISELPQLRDDRDALTYLTSLGLKSYARSSQPLLSLMLESCKQTLQAAPRERAEIDAIVYATSSYDPHLTLGDIPTLAAELGVHRATPYGVFLGQCTNFSQALAVARNMLWAGEARNVLLILGDRFDDSRGTRVLEARTSVLSDGACSCLVSSQELPGGFELLGLRHHYVPEISRIDRRQGFMQYIEAISAGLSESCRRQLSELGLETKDFSWLLTGNHNISVLKNFAALAGFGFAKVYRENLARFAHSFAADQFIALADLKASSRLRPGERLFMLGSGHLLWGTVAVEVKP